MQFRFISPNSADGVTQISIVSSMKCLQQSILCLQISCRLVVSDWPVKVADAFLDSR